MTNFSGLNVLVTGANGFLGRHLLDRLNQQNANVHAVSRCVPSSGDGVQWVQGDLANGDWVHTMVATVEPDIIYHLASASQGGQDSQFVLSTFENDLRSTVNVLLAAKQCGCKRLILASSLEEPVCDGRPITVSSPYAAAKASCTYYGLMFHQLYGVPVTMLRAFMTYGAGQKSHKVIPYTILSLLSGKPPRLSSGVRLVDWVYVQDVITAFITAAVAPEAVGTTIDIGSGSLVSLREVVEEIHRFIPGSPTPILGGLADRVLETVRRADTEPAMRILDWKASTPLSVGLSQTIESYREQTALLLPD